MSFMKIIGASLLVTGAVMGAALASVPFGLKLPGTFVVWLLFIACSVFGTLTFPERNGEWVATLKAVGAFSCVLAVSSLGAIAAKALGAIPGEAVGLSQWGMFIGCICAGVVCVRTANVLAGAVGDLEAKSGGR